MKMLKIQNFLNSFLLAYSIDMICELEFIYKIDLIFWTYLWTHTLEYFLSLLVY